MSDYEKQLVSLIKFKPNDYGDHQDYLAALARTADRWFATHDKTQAIFDNLDDGLVNWFEDAISAMNNRVTIPDFPDREIEEPHLTAPDEEEEVDDDNEPSKPEAARDPGNVAEVGAASGPGEALTAHSAEAGTAANVEEPKAPKKPKVKKQRIPTRAETYTGALDRWGIVIGTKKWEALKLYEHGTTAKELEAKVGGRHYNVLQEMMKAGHRVEKLPGHVFKLTHKDDLKG